MSTMTQRQTKVGSSRGAGFSSFWLLAAVVNVASGLVPAPARTVVIGGGPAGLTTAISLARRGWTNVEVLERLQPPPKLSDAESWSDTARFYLIGLNGRGISVLEEVGVWDRVRDVSADVRGRREWSPGSVAEGVETVRTDRPPIKIVARDRLVACLLEVCGELGINVRHGVEVAKLAWDEDEQAVLSLQRCGPEDWTADDDENNAPFLAEEKVPFLVACEGVRRGGVSEAMETDTMYKEKFKVTQYEDDNVRRYKTVPFKPPKDWRRDINYSARTSGGKVNFDALPTADGDEYCGVLLVRPDDVLATPGGLKDVAAARAYFDDCLPMISPYIEDSTLASVIEKPVSRFPAFAYAGPRLHRGKSTVLLGDAIHAVKPYFGLGANTALQDVAVLNEALDTEDSLGDALELYSRKRASEAKDLVELSRSFDHPGPRMFIQFIGPIILDSIFSKLAPRIFAPNPLALLQRPELSFGAIRRRKRQDRLIQLAFLGSVAWAVASLSLRIVLFAARRLLSRYAPMPL